MTPVVQPIVESRPLSFSMSLGRQTPFTTALTMTELRKAFGVGLMIPMYGSMKIQMSDVMMHASCEVAPVIRLTSDLLMLPETGAEPIRAAIPHAPPWAISSRLALHEIPLSISKPGTLTVPEEAK